MSAGRSQKREASVQAMITKGYTRERAEHLLFGVLPGALRTLLACTDCGGRDAITDPISQEVEPYTCPSCGGSGKAADQITTTGQGS